MNRMFGVEDIRPFNDKEAVKALRKASFNPLTLVASRYLFPEDSIFKLSGMLGAVKGVDDFQKSVMAPCVKSIMDRTSDALIVEGIENVSDIGGGFVVISNHRDIVMDPALLQYSFFLNDISLTELCVGSNLLSSGYVSDIMRSNRMVKVMRGLSARDIYSSSQVLSGYIRDLIVNRKRPLWIAQREGRAKNGLDLTEQAVLKMLDMSGCHSFKENFAELHLVPMSISYEFEPCDAMRARELLISRSRRYVKGRGEDMRSILEGIRHRKGNVCIHFSKPVPMDIINKASECKGNERYKVLCDALDASILDGYRLWPNNYIAADLLEDHSRRSEKYSVSQLETFQLYAERQLDTIDNVKERLDRVELRKIFYSMYANPVFRKESGV